MDMLKEWGVNCILILDEDGTGTLDLFLEVDDLKWEAKDATTVTITAEDESYDLKLKDDKLVLEVEGDKLIFTKSDKDLSGTVKKDRENVEKEEEIDEAVEDDDVQSVEISPAVTVADDDLCTITITENNNLGYVDIFGIDKEALDGALARIKAIVAIPEVGETYHGKVRSIVAFGAFVEIMPGKDALLHISEIDYKRFETMEETGLKEGDEIDVKLIGMDPKTNKLKLSRKVLLPKPEGLSLIHI